MRQIVGCTQSSDAAEYKLLNWAKVEPDPHGVIYWHIANFPPTMDKYKTLFALQTCFNKWQTAFDMIEPLGRVIELKPTDDWHQAHVRLYFIPPGVSTHTITISDGSKKTINTKPLDGPSGVLAHRMPHSFDLYFDESEQWSEIHKYEKVGKEYVLFVQLWQVAMHELGHMFDIGHATDEKAIMYPTYDGQHVDITTDDLAGLTAAFTGIKHDVKSKLPVPKAVITDPRVKHIQDSLPKHATKKYYKRDLSQIRQIVVHHSADNGTPESIAKYHVSHNKWPGIGYHFLIDNTGQIFQTNDIDVISYNVSNQNTKSLGICLIGNFENENPSDAQIESLKWLLTAVRASVGELPLYGHKDRDATLCPGKNLYNLLKSKNVS